MQRIKGVIIVLALIFTVTACGGQNEDMASDETALSSGELVVDNVTANLTLPTATGAVYMRISNGTGQDDVLLGAEVPGCGTVELHEMSMDGDIMRMRPVEGGRIPIPAGQTVMLQRGGLHVMCIDKTGEFVVGDSVPVTLQFERAGTVEVSAQVIEPGEMPMDNMEGDSMNMGGE